MDIKNHNVHKLSYTLMIRNMRLLANLNDETNLFQNMPDLVQSSVLLFAKHKMGKEKKHHRIAFKVRKHIRKAKIVITTDDRRLIGVHQ